MGLLFLAIVATFAAAAVTVFLFFANAMSDSPSTPFQGKVWLVLAWGVAILLWVAWLL